MPTEATTVEAALAERLDERLLAEYAARLGALRYTSVGMVEALILSPRMDEHRQVSALDVVPDEGVVGQYPGKQWWRGKRSIGRQITTVNAEVLGVLGIACDVPGDNVIIGGLDLSQFDPGDVLRVGDALLVATPTPHRPCAKFARRTSLTKMKAISAGRYRGTMFNALRPATLRVGDEVERLIVSRP